MTRCIVSFHAHPDDEALLTGGTLARLAAQGHRVVLVTATAGALGLSDAANGDLAATRLAELRRSADALGCARVVCLDYPDSGWTSAAEYEPAVGSFATVGVDVAADRLAEILREEQADILTTYDARGGYGHLDHLRVHEVGAAAAERAGTPVVLQATIDRTMLERGMRLLRLTHLVPAGTSAASRTWFSGRGEITHRVDVRPYARQKKAALAAHRSQAVGGDGPRTAKILLSLPLPVFKLVCGTEWFVQTGAARPLTPATDPLQNLAQAVAA